MVAGFNQHGRIIHRGFIFLEYYFIMTPVTVAELSEAWTVFDGSEAMIACSNPSLGMDV
jgi:hypothetical protein